MDCLWFGSVGGASHQVSVLFVGCLSVDGRQWSCSDECLVLHLCLTDLGKNEWYRRFVLVWGCILL